MSKNRSSGEPGPGQQRRRASALDQLHRDEAARRPASSTECTVTMLGWLSAASVLRFAREAGARGRRSRRSGGSIFSATRRPSVAILGEIHVAHPAGSDLRQDRVMPQGLANHRLALVVRRRDSTKSRGPRGELKIGRGCWAVMTDADLESPAEVRIRPREGRSGQRVMTLTVGSTLGPYVVEAQLGAGGMGEVYRALDTRLNRTVAIKVLSAPLTEKPHFRKRFEREARVIAALEHPHICPLYDVGEEHGATFLVMQHLHGETLADHLKRGDE